MIRFRLTDENAEDNHTQESFDIELKFKDGMEFDDWCSEDEDFDEFMDMMETTNNEPWSGVHDGSGGDDSDGVEYVEYSSYEILDFYAAIKKWETFFKRKKKLSKGFQDNNVQVINPIRIKRFDNFINDLNGLSFVFTGIRRPDLVEEIESRGGKELTSVTKNVTHLICKDKISLSGKMKKAIELGVTIMSVEELEYFLSIK